MDSKLIALERALLNCQAEISKFKSAETLTTISDVPENLSKKTSAPTKKTLGLKRSGAIFLSAQGSNKKKVPEVEDLSEGQDDSE